LYTFVAVLVDIARKHQNLMQVRLTVQQGRQGKVASGVVRKVSYAGVGGIVKEWHVVGRWPGGQVGRWAGGQRAYVLAINDFACCSLVCKKGNPS
jgi:hypothetical protein